MSRAPSSGGGIQSAKPMPPRFPERSEEIEPRQSPRGQARQGRGGEAQCCEAKGVPFPLSPAVSSLWGLICTVWGRIALA